jgi:hypothetical protein
MKAPDIRTVEMTRKIHDRHARRLAEKTPTEVIALYREGPGRPRSKMLDNGRSRTAGSRNLVHSMTPPAGERPSAHG